LNRNRRLLAEGEPLAADERIAVILLDEEGDQNKIRNSNLEIRNNVQKSKYQKLSKQKPPSQTPFCLVIAVEYSDLFRHSNFGFKISLRLL
jgi:hypothetical protein